jgi:hypothetical protein
MKMNKKYHASSTPHSVTSQYTIILILTTVRNTNLVYKKMKICHYINVHIPVNLSSFFFLFFFIWWGGT